MDLLTKTRKITNLPKELQTDFKLISFGENYHLIGSALITSLTYNSDYDINQKKKISDKQFKDHIDLIKKHQNIWLYSLNKTDKYIQINTICNINGILTDVNNTIFINNQPTKKQKEKTLKEDIEQYLKDGNYFKSIKRLYTLISLDNNKNKKLIEYLTAFLNSNIGLLNSIINQLNIIKNFYTIEKNQNELIKNNLELCKLNLNKIYCVSIEDKLFKMFNLREISNLIKILDAKLQAYTKTFIQLNRSILKI